MQRTRKTPAAVVRRGSLCRFPGGTPRQVRLVAFPWCGAGASVYRRLAQCLPEHVELLSVQLPGREDRFDEGRLLRMESIVDHVIGDILSIFDRPLALFGHSMGALIAYEVALALRDRHGREPSTLIVSGHGAPHCGGASRRCWHKASEGDFIDNIRQLGGTPAELLEDRSMMRAFGPLIRADFEVVETYDPRPAAPLSCPLVACAGDEDDEVSPETMRGWLRYTDGPKCLHWFEGGHFYLNSQPALLARQIEEWITPGGLALRKNSEIFI